VGSTLSDRPGLSRIVKAACPCPPADTGPLPMGVGDVPEKPEKPVGEFAIANFELEIFSFVYKLRTTVMVRQYRRTLYFFMR